MAIAFTQVLQHTTLHVYLCTLAGRIIIIRKNQTAILHGFTRKCSLLIWTYQLLSTRQGDYKIAGLFRGVSQFGGSSSLKFARL